MRWLHLTDIHVGKQDNATQQTAIKDLLETIANNVTGPVDFVLITGDLAYSGSRSEYELFTRSILSEIRRIGVCSGRPVIVVPGNHDLDCDSSSPISWDHLGADRQITFFEESPRGQKTRRSRASSFREFSDFTRQNALVAPDPLSEVSRVHSMALHSRTINFVLTNTALFSDKAHDLKDEAQTPAPTESIRSRLQEATPADYTLIIGHHPIEWFLHSHREPFKSLLAKHDAVYLHGHTHQVQTQFGPTGLVSMGFGAVYQAPLADAPKGFYRNTFSLCELTDSALHIAIWTWEPDFGRWVQTRSLPSEFKDKSDKLTDGYVLPFPCRRKDAKAERMAAVSPRPPTRTPPHPDRVTLLDDFTLEDWKDLLAFGRLLGTHVVGAEELEVVTQSTSEIVFNFKTASGVHCVRCLPGPGNVISRVQVEALNTEFDFEGLGSCRVISLGIVSDEARTLYLRLRARKDLTIWGNAEIARSLLAVLDHRQKEHIESLDAGSNLVELVVHHRDVYVLVIERSQSQWFYVVDREAKRLGEHDPVVRATVRSRPEFGRVQYRTKSILPPADGPPGQLPAVPTFDRRLYLAECAREFNAVRYAALATTGIRLTEIPLEELYVEANADLEQNSEASAALDRAITENLGGLALDDHLRVQLEASIRRQFKATAPREGGHTRRLYKQHPALLILGDPGSGKTCFVKHEILAYCNPPKEEGAWYSGHIPVFVSLADAARYPAEESLLHIASKQAARRGLELPLSSLEEFVAKGAIAFFFDGLDEVVSVKQRASLVSRLTTLLDATFGSGNRFVVTSRPAAVQPVEMPTPLSVVQLRGLTDAEIRLLASRVLALRLSSANGTMKLGLGEERLSAEDRTLIDDILRDCERSPGIARIASNPLLLTLLTMVYANGGAPAAKRHRIYAAAVQTLVTVRNRQPGQRVLSEADLRRRLGAVALSVFMDPSGTIPLRREVVDVLTKELAAAKGAPASSVDAETFLQDVAESTGLLVLHKSTPGDAGTDSVTFMHHSFLEYYAAIGLAASDYLDSLPSLARQPRWREVISLLGGIVGDTGDVTAFVERLLKDTTSNEGLTLQNVLFAFDCALECDVPPESAERALLDAIGKALSSGPALLDRGLRQAIGRRMSSLLASTGSPRAIAFLIVGLRSKDARVRAAYLDLLGHVAMEWELPSDLVSVFDALCRDPDTDVRLAVLSAMGRSGALRTPAAIEVLKESVKGSKAARYLSAVAAETAPGLAQYVWEPLCKLMDDNNVHIANAAASAVLKAGLRIDPLAIESRQLVIQALARFEDAPTVTATISTIPLRWSRAAVEQLLTSTQSDQRLLGLRLLPWVQGEEQFVRDRIMDVVGSSAPGDEIVAALGALRIAEGARRLLTVADSAAIMRLLNPSGPDVQTRDVRIAAARNLGEYSRSEPVVGVLLRHATWAWQGSRGAEFGQTVRSLARAGVESAVAHDFVCSRLDERISSGVIGDATQKGTLVDLLRSLQQFELPLSAKLARQLRLIVQDHRFEATLRKEALLALASGVQPERWFVEYLIGLLADPPYQLSGATCKAVLAFVKRVRRKIESVRAVVPSLRDLQLGLHEHLAEHPPARHGEDGRVQEVRGALEQIEGLLHSYSEFVGRTED